VIDLIAVEVERWIEEYDAVAEPALLGIGDRFQQQDRELLAVSIDKLFDHVVDHHAAPPEPPRLFTPIRIQINKSAQRQASYQLVLPLGTRWPRLL